MQKKLVGIILVWTISLGAAMVAFLLYKRTQGQKKGEVVMNVIVHEGQEKPKAATAVAKKKGTRALDDMYAKDQLSFYNKTKVLQQPAPEVIQELNEIGLTREELIQSIASLLVLVDDEMRAKNIATDYIASLGFQLTGNEYVKLLQAAKITDEFYYTNVLKNTAAYVKLPLTLPQTDAVLAPLKTSDGRSRGMTLLEKEALRQRQTP